MSSDSKAIAPTLQNNLLPLQWQALTFDTIPGDAIELDGEFSTRLKRAWQALALPQGWHP